MRRPTCALLAATCLCPTSSTSLPEPGRGGEIHLTDAMAMQMGDRGIRGLVIDDIGFDTGQKTDWLRANVELSLRTDDSLAIAAMLKAALESNGF